MAGSIAHVIHRREPTASVWVEPFCGMCSVARAAWKLNPTYRFHLSDANESLIVLLQAIQTGWMPSKTLAKLTNGEYKRIRSQADSLTPEYAFIATALSFGGKWFGGLAGVNNSRYSTEDYFNRACVEIQKMHEFFCGADVDIQCSEYEYSTVVDDCILYCDPPYLGTTKIFKPFDSNRFTEWVVRNSLRSRVYVSEYTQLDRSFIPVWSKTQSEHLSKTIGAKRTERLYDVILL